MLQPGKLRIGHIIRKRVQVLHGATVERCGYRVLRQLPEGVPRVTGHERASSWQAFFIEQDFVALRHKIVAIRCAALAPSQIFELRGRNNISSENVLTVSAAEHHSPARHRNNEAPGDKYQAEA